MRSTSDSRCYRPRRRSSIQRARGAIRSLGIVADERGIRYLGGHSPVVCRARVVRRQGAVGRHANSL